MSARPPWEELERPGRDEVTIEGVVVRRRSRVRLRPRPGGDVLDLALDGRTAIVEELVETTDGEVQLAVCVEDDPGRDLGELRQPGHRFFFSPAEVEPLGPPPAAEAPAPRILVAGLGNVFMADDGFGVACVERLAREELPPGVRVEDFGIRGMDLAYALAGYDVAILVDAVPRGGRPGTLYVIEPELDEGAVAVDTHGMDPVKVLALAQALGDELPRVLVVGCEPAVRMRGDEDEIVAELSAPVRASLDEAVRLLRSLLGDLGAGQPTERRAGG
jgi:hydrogenase maturation protease